MNDWQKTAAQRSLALGAALLGSGVVAVPAPFSLGVPFTSKAAAPVLRDATEHEVASGTLKDGRLALPVPAPGLVFPTGCTGSASALAGVLVGSVAVGRSVWRPVPAGLTPGLEPSGAPGKGAGLLFLKSAFSGRASVDCSQPGGPGSMMTLEGRFPGGWSRVRVTVSVDRRGSGPPVNVALSPERSAWRWERAGSVSAGH